MKRRIELNSDMGESFGNYVVGRPEEVMKLINHASVACGFHAGDPVVMHQTVRLCKQYNVVLGAHPGFPDLIGFGRRYMSISLEEATNYIIYQVGALKNFAEVVGIKVKSAKPHGAFCSWAMESEEHAKAVLDGLKTIGPDFALLLPTVPQSILHEMAEASGIRLIREIYPGLSVTSDRGYSLSRKYEADPVEETKIVVKFLRTGKIDTLDGKEIAVRARSICIHGDMPNAPEVLMAMRDAIEKEGVELRAALEDSCS